MGWNRLSTSVLPSKTSKTLSSITATINSALLILGITFPSSIHAPSLCKEKAPEGAFSHVR